MKQKKQRNTKARVKQKIRSLRLKSLLTRIFARRQRKLEKMNQPKGRTIVGEAKKFAMDYHKLFLDGDGGAWMFDHGHQRSLNQRQKRKRARQNGRPVKKA